MGTLFFISWLISIIIIVVGLTYLAVGITYKNLKKFLISILIIMLSILFFFLPYYVAINKLIKN